MADQLSGPPPEQRRGTPEGGELTGGEKLSAQKVAGCTGDDAAPVIGLGGKPAGPRQRELLELLDAGKPVTDRALLEAWMDDKNIRGTRKVHVLTAPKLRQATLPRRDRAAVAEAYRRSDEQFWRWWRKRQEDFPG